MDWSALERILLGLSWPILAAIALPFVIKRIDKLITAVGDARSVMDNLPKFVDAGQILQTLKQQITELGRSQAELGQQQQDLLRMQQLFEESQELRERQREIEEQPLEELAEQFSGDPPPRPQGRARNELFTRLDGEWGQVKAAMARAFARLGLDPPDLRSVAYEARRLSHGRRKRRLDAHTVEKVTALQSIYKGFLRAAKRDALTEEIVNNFAIEAKSVQGSLDEL